MSEKMALFQKIAQKTKFSIPSVSAVVTLFQDGATTPFIARYRREKTGNLDEVAIDDIFTAYTREIALQERRSAIIALLAEQGHADKKLLTQLALAETVRELEDIYLPFKQRRKSAADIAREAGLEPLARKIVSERHSERTVHKILHAFVTKKITADDALAGAVTILAEEMAYNISVRKSVRRALQNGVVVSAVKRGVTSPDVHYQDYFDFSEPLSRLAPHRLLALLRGEKAGTLSFHIEARNRPGMLMRAEQIHFNFTSFFTEQATKKAWQNYLKTSLNNELIKESESVAHHFSSQIFFKNFESLLLAPFLGQKSVIAIDPGIRTGCKAVLLNDEGLPVGERVLYLHQKKSETEKLHSWLFQKSVVAIAVGKGTFGRETVDILNEMIPEDLSRPIIPVSEDGASVYSASKIARDELPGMDISFRGAVSIGRRLQDPLSELVKIDPASVGVGQYQHDIPTKMLKETLERCVHWIVNRVGVNLNSATEHLLAQISGLDKTKAKNIVNYREKNGPFVFRKDFKKVKGIGEMSYKLAAGFLLIQNSSELLDSTGVHPENYSDLYRASTLLSVGIADIMENPSLLESERVASLSFPDKDSLKQELLRRGRDVRPVLQLHSTQFSVASFDELHSGMTLSGVIANITAFGAFVDIGLKQKGLIHISEVSSQFVTDIHSLLFIGQEVVATVLSIDSERQRIALSLKRGREAQQK
ncbi:helix-hairpin-helix domain-containing protein [bacterium]|nr:helix-hairpin-helix domain-containing protein [bacterium]